MAVLRPLKVVIENYPEGQTEELDAVNHPDDPSAGSRKIRFSPRALRRARRLHGEPAQEVLPPVARQGGAAALRLFRHLPRGGEERGRRGGRAALHLRSGDARRQPPPDGRKVQATLHWVSAADVGAGRGAALQPAVRPARSRRRRFRRRPQPELARGAARRPARAGAGRAAMRRTPCSSSARATSAATPTPSPAGPCSTAPSACATPGPRCRPARKLSHGAGHGVRPSSHAGKRGYVAAIGSDPVTPPVPFFSPCRSRRQRAGIVRPQTGLTGETMARVGAAGGAAGWRVPSRLGGLRRSPGSPATSKPSRSAGSCGCR